jgi:hypothetical protein
MHTEELYPEFFEFQIDRVQATLDELLPERNEFDRFGIVVTEPLGSLGASLLLQAGTAHWYDVKPERRGTVPIYPENYAFHVGGPHGDHAGIGIWAPRKEVFVAPADPVALLTQINDKAITRLVIPDGPHGDLDRLSWGQSTWVEQASALDRLTSCFAYSVTGDVQNADVVLREKHPRLEQDPGQTFNLEVAAKALYDRESVGFVGSLPGHSVPADNHRWVDYVRSRSAELPKELTDRLAAERAAARARTGGVRVESFRRLSGGEALAIIAGLDPRAVV